SGEHRKEQHICNDCPIKLRKLSPDRNPLLLILLINNQLSVFEVFLPEFLFLIMDALKLSQEFLPYILYHSLLLLILRVRHHKRVERCLALLITAVLINIVLHGSIKILYRGLYSCLRSASSEQKQKEQRCSGNPVAH